MLSLLSAWQFLFAFEVALFSSYTVLMHLYSKKYVSDPLKAEVFSKGGHLPTITLIIPMYNEEKVIEEKIENTSHLDYPEDKLEVILLNDHSTDLSQSVSEMKIKGISLKNARVVMNQGGKGKARALNWIFPSLKSEITIISDADAFLKSDSLLWVVNHYKDSHIGGVTGKIVILSDKARLSKSQEDSYRFYFDIWRQGESQIQSVSVCNGPLMSFRTDLLHNITIDPDAYADDSDLLFKIIGLGYRVVYEPSAIVYERVPLSTKGRIIQKMKRINGLRKVYINNLNLLGKGMFGKIVFPYALMVHIVSPIIVLSLTILYPLVVFNNPGYLGFLILFFIPKLENTLLSFIITQLIMNFSFLVKTAGSWEAIEDARYNLKQKN
ncbi:glycosyltransferase [Methanosarcina sp. 2.H.A.1B.4]|uniref:glycosyltransferase n=1 Tax=Methanosarcina sp. 2.H.A.1B.4 TaxID=1483600 RepID=UPI0009E3407A|nr:glycosyltransferase [Methanosarcina sp. 2.H.A.1B.4]